MAVTIRVDGPLFALGAGPVQDALAGAVTEITLTGEREARLMAQPAPGGVFRTREYAAAHGYFQTGHYNRSIIGVPPSSSFFGTAVTGSLHGIIFDSNVAYGPWLEGVSSRNDSTRFKGYGIFRKTRDKLAGIADGILNRYVRAAVELLN